MQILFSIVTLNKTGYQVWITLLRSEGYFCLWHDLAVASKKLIRRFSNLQLKHAGRCKRLLSEPPAQREKIS